VSQFKGTYVFKQNGIEIGRSTNLITSIGRKIILQYLTRAREEWAADMAIGALNTTPTVADTQLNFETGRYPVILKSFLSATSTDPDLILVRATIPENLYANIYEIGLYPTKTSFSTISNRNNIILEEFSNLTNWSASTGTIEINSFTPQGSGSPRIGANSVRLASSTTYINTNLSVPFSNYSSLDNLQILLYNSTAGTVTITLTDISGTTQSINFTTTANTGYSYLSANFGSSISNFTYITGISISTDSSASLTIDAIKASDASEISVEESLVSKSVLTTPIAKLYNVPLDVEYYIELL
jgi:hypothetical protein